MTDKEKLINFCASYVNERIHRIQDNILGIQESLTSETKSSAGDKHETGRAMLQLEREKLGQQLLQAENMKQTLSKVTVTNNTKTVGLGSLVYTEKGNYFLAISAGEFKLDVDKVYCISVSTPIGKLLVGKSNADVFIFNGETIKIKAIV